MNYYEHHIGDYAKATSHLTFVEDAAYSRLIRKYYDMEMPLPSDLALVQRLVGARTREEKSAVKTVLEEFFFLEADGWHNKRADEEIAAYHAKSLKARESANIRWKREQEKRNAKTMRPHSEGNAPQTPVPSHQTPIKEKTKTPRPAAVAAVFDSKSFDLFWDIYDKKVGRAESEMVWRKLNLDQETIQKILVAAAAYRDANPDKRYRKDPSGWLNKRKWNDEIVKAAPEHKQQLTPYQQSIKAASISIFGNLENPHEQSRIIDITPTAPGLLGG